ncbi:feruloyl esterase, partial [Pseudomonas syringae pv. pisi str. 1704B]
STDMGHQAADEHFGDDPQKRADFAHRGVHLTALASKKLIAAFYGRKAQYAYFSGCSDGGREALIEAQRYPDDFGGIIAGAPALNFQVQKTLYHGWMARSNRGADGKPILLASRLPLLHKAVLEQCDLLDGQIDGLIADPRICHFDPAALQCKASADPTTCLSAEEVATVRRFYEGPKDPVSGERLTLGGPQPGSELAWAGVFVPISADQTVYSEKAALEAIRNVVFEKNPPAGFDLNALDFDKKTFDQLRPLHALYDATNPDLSPFASRGGKLILWHGWADPNVSPLNTLAYHEGLEAEMGKTRTEAFSRLYMLPGVYHCGGGGGSKPGRSADADHGLGRKKPGPGCHRCPTGRPRQGRQQAETTGTVAAGVHGQGKRGQSRTYSQGLPVPVHGRVRPQGLREKRKQLPARPAVDHGKNTAMDGQRVLQTLYASGTSGALAVASVQRGRIIFSSFLTWHANQYRIASIPERGIEKNPIDSMGWKPKKYRFPAKSKYV